jgi:outer membrane lipoprotein carrier protein
MKETFSACLFGLLLMAQLAVAGGNSNSEELVGLLEPMENLAGEFSQVQKDPENNIVSESRGVFVMQRPGLLRWETLEPFPQLLITDGATLWLYDADLEQVSVSSVDTQLNHTPAVIFSGNLELIDQQFLVKQSAEGLFSLRPRQSDGLFQRLDLRFQKQALVAMTILDGFGQRTDFVFSNTAIGKPVAVSDFVFVPPEGTDVLIHD